MKGLLILGGVAVFALALGVLKSDRPHLRWPSDSTHGPTDRSTFESAAQESPPSVSVERVALRPAAAEHEGVSLMARRAGLSTPIDDFSVHCNCGFDGTTEVGSILFPSAQAHAGHLLTFSAQGFESGGHMLDGTEAKRIEALLVPSTSLTVALLADDRPIPSAAQVDLFDATSREVALAGKGSARSVQMAARSPGIFAGRCLSGDWVRVQVQSLELWREVPAHGGILTVEVPSGSGRVRLVDVASGEGLGGLEVFVRSIGDATIKVQTQGTDSTGVLEGLPSEGKVQLVFPADYEVRDVISSKGLAYETGREGWGDVLEFSSARSLAEGEGVVVELARPPLAEVRFLPPFEDLDGLHGSASLQVLSSSVQADGSQRWNLLNEWIGFDVVQGKAAFRVIQGTSKRAKRLVLCIPGFMPAVEPWPDTQPDVPVEFAVRLSRTATTDFMLQGFRGDRLGFSVVALDATGSLAIESRFTSEGTLITLPADIAPHALRWTTSAFGDLELEVDAPPMNEAEGETQAVGIDEVLPPTLRVAVGRLVLEGEETSPWNWSACHASGGIVPLGVRSAGERIDLPAGTYWLGSRDKVQRLAGSLRSPVGSSRKEVFDGLQSVEVLADETLRFDLESTKTLTWEGYVDVRSFFPQGLSVDVGFGPRPSVLPMIPSDRLTKVEPSGSFRIDGLREPPDWVAACIMRRSGTGALFPFWFTDNTHNGRPVVEAGWLDFQGVLPAEGAVMSVSCLDLEGRPTWISPPDGLRALLDDEERLDLPSGSYSVFISKGMEVYARFENVVVERDRGTTMTLSE